MEEWRRRIGLALGVVAFVIVTYATIYRWAMATFEGREIPFVKALQVTVESLTTAGFGGHAPWESTVMNVLVLAMNLSGVLLVFLGLPLFAIPLLRRALESPPPTRSDLTDHVIICSHSQQDEVLREELEAGGVPYLFVDGDPEVVTELVEAGRNAIHGDPEQIETLRAANAAAARALVADVDDETNPVVILSARRVNPELRIVSVVRDYRVVEYHEFAGADEVVLARQQLGESFAMRARTSFERNLRETIEVENDLEVTELLVEEGSPLAGETLASASVLDELRITVVGMWIGGKFVVSPPPETVLEENTILLAMGEHDHVEQVTARPVPTHYHPERVVVCGYGTVGYSVTEALREQGIEVTVVDLEEKAGVDVVGDVTDPETLERARIREAETVILALDEDTPTIYGTLVLKQFAPDVEIIARADDTDSVWKLYNSGADYVLSLPTLTGEILASMLVDEVEIVTPQMEFEFVRSEAPGLVGRTLAEADVRSETGCTVIAVEREGRLVTDLGPDFRIGKDDVLIVAGRHEAIEAFERFGG